MQPHDPRVVALLSDEFAHEPTSTSTWRLPSRLPDDQGFPQVGLPGYPWQQIHTQSAA
jgi:hypothetical protein